MRKVTAYELLSLDGVAEAPDGFIEWDDALDDHLADLIATQDAVILGRRTYDEWAAFWPNSTIEPFAGFINRAPKHVATSTPLNTGWSNAEVIDGELISFVRDLAHTPGDDIGVHASITVVQSLLAADLIDELRLVIAPSVVGRGRRLFDGLSTLRLTATTSRTSPTGSLIVTFGRAGRS